MATAARPKAASVSRWTSFLTANPAPYTAIFAKGKTAFPKGVTLTKAVRHSLTSLATGEWETATIKQGKITVVLVAFADKADFDKLKSQHNGKPWPSIVSGSVDGFSVTLP